MPNTVATSIKSQFSLAYLSAVAAKVDVAVDQKHKHVDDAGIDLELIKINGNTIDEAFPFNTVKIQIKGTACDSTSMISETSDYIKYRLINKLIKVGNMYLVVLILPKEPDFDSWLKQDHNELTICRCAYFLKLNTDLEAGYIEIPKINMLTPEALLSMFSVSKDDF